MKKNTYAKVLVVIFSLSVIFVISIANKGLISEYFPIVFKIPYYDKIGHFLIMGILSFLLNLSLNLKTINLLSSKILLGSLIITGLVTIEEFSQIALKFRSFSLADLAFDYLGIFCFGKLAKYVNKSPYDKNSGKK